MRKMNFRLLAIVLAVSFLVGCSTQSSTLSSQEVPVQISQYLDIDSELAMIKGKSDFSSLVLDRDEFTKEASYYLPKNEEVKVAFNKIIYNFSLYKRADSNEFFPTIRLSYGGDDWIFMESAIFKINDDVMNFTPMMDPFRQTLGSSVLEVIYFELTKDQVNFLGKTKSITDLDIRVNTVTFEEMQLSEIEYRGLNKILSAYRYYLSTLK